MSLGHGSNIVRDGLVVHLDAANIKSYPRTGTTWTDLKSIGNTGTLIDSPTFDSANQGSFVFNGSNNYIAYNTNLGAFDNMTIQMFVKPKSNAGGFRGFAAANYNAGPDFSTGFNIDMSTSSTTSFNKCHFEGGILRVDYGTNFLSTSLPFNEWYNICFTVSPTTVQFYLNGEAGMSTARLNNFSTTIGMDYLVIGRRHLNATTSDSQISLVQIYNRALTAVEVKQNFEAHRGRYGI
jgi:hypothetical protein